MDRYGKIDYKLDPLTEIRNAGIITSGDVYWVSSVSDDQHRQRTLDMGRKVVKTSLQAAIDDARSDHNDYVLVVPTDGGTARNLGTAVDVNEDRLHILGLGAKPGFTAYNGLTFRGYVAADGIDTELVNISGAGVEMAGLKFLGTSGTNDNGTMTRLFQVGTASSGTPHDLHLHGLHIENTQAAAPGGTARIVNISGDVAGLGIQGVTIEKNWLGNRHWIPQDILTCGGTAGPGYLTLRKNTFVIDAQATSDSFLTLGTGETGYVKLEDNEFINVEAGTKTASAVEGAVLADNPVLSVRNSGVNVTAIGTDTEFLNLPTQAGTDGAGMHNPYIGIIGTSPIPVA